VNNPGHFEPTGSQCRSGVYFGHMLKRISAVGAALLFLLAGPDAKAAALTIVQVEFDDDVHPFSAELIP